MPSPRDPIGDGFRAAYLRMGQGELELDCHNINFVTPEQPGLDLLDNSMR